MSLDLFLDRYEIYNKEESIARLGVGGCSLFIGVVLVLTSLLTSYQNNQ